MSEQPTSDTHSNGALTATPAQLRTQIDEILTELRYLEGVESRPQAA